MSARENRELMTVGQWGIRIFVLVLLFGLAIFVLRPFVVAVYELVSAISRLETEQQARKIADAAAVEERTRQYNVLFTDARLREIAADRMRAIDFDMVLKRACSAHSTRVECDSLDAADLLGRWARIRTETELARFGEGGAR